MSQWSKEIENDMGVPIRLGSSMSPTSLQVEPVSVY